MPGLRQARKARLSIPRVNQRPGVAKRKAVTRYGLKNRIAATAPRTQATTTSQATNSPSVPATQTAPLDPFQATSKPVSAPSADLFQAPSFSPQAGQADPRDASYWANLAKLRFTGQQEYAKNLAEQQMADTAYSDALQTAIRNRALQQRSLGEDAIRSNLGASGWLNRNEALQTQQYTQERAQSQLTKTQEDQARAAARAAIQQGFSLEAASLLAEAAARYAERQAGEAEDAPPDAAPGGPVGKGNAPKGKKGGPFFGPKGPGGYTKQALKKRNKR